MGVWIINGLSKHLPSTVRLPSRFDDCIILEVPPTSGKPSMCPWAKGCYARAREVPSKLKMDALQGHPIVPLKSEACLYSLFNANISQELTMRNLPAVEEALQTAITLRQVKHGEHSYRSLFRTIFRSQNDSLPNKLNLCCDRSALTEWDIRFT